MNSPLIRTLAEAESFDREKRAAELKQLMRVGIARGWVKLPTPKETRRKASRLPGESKP